SADLRSDPAVSDVRRGPISQDGRTVSLLVALRPDDPGDQERAVERIAHSVDAGPLKLSPAGSVAVAIAARHDLSGQLWKLELLVLPFALLVLAAILGVRDGAAAALCAALAVAGTLAMLRIAHLLASVSIVG